MILLLFIISSCTQYVRKDEIDDYIAEYMIDYTDIAYLTAASTKWRNALTGGGDALDGIAYSGIADGDVTFVF